MNKRSFIKTITMAIPAVVGVGLIAANKPVINGEYIIKNILPKLKNDSIVLIYSVKSGKYFDPVNFILKEGPHITGFYDTDDRLKLKKDIIDVELSHNLNRWERMAYYVRNSHGRYIKKGVIHFTENSYNETINYLTHYEHHRVEDWV